MAVIKCKMCGGDLQIIEGSTVCECEYCGTKQTVPSADNEKKLTLFGRAGRLLRACEFDKAAGVFETIIADFPEEAEAYWGLVLCKYGIEYVDDPATGKKIPTCHRSSFDSVMDDSNYEQACENTDAVARRVYRDEARAIEELRQAILQVSGKEEPYDVFISYKETDANGERTLDSVIAQDIYKELTDEGYRVFFSRISLEDKLGTEYEPYIFAALNSAKVMLVVGTDYENFDAVWVKNEWSRFLKLIARGQKKTLIPVFKNMDPYDMPKEFAKLQAQDMGKIGAMQDLMRGVDKLIPKAKPVSSSQDGPTIIQSGPNAQALLQRGNMALEDGKWLEAKGYFDQALNIDAQNGEAYFGLLMSTAEVHNPDEFISIAVAANVTDLLQDKMYLRAKQYADAGLRSKLMEMEQQFKAKSNDLESLRKQAQYYGRMIALGKNHVLGLCSDGTVVAAGEGICCDTTDWEDVIAIDADEGISVGLKNDGTVLVAGKDSQGRCDVSGWRNITAISAAPNQTIGLKDDGTVVGTHKAIPLSDWHDIVRIKSVQGVAFGLRADGTVLCSLERNFPVSNWRDVVSISASGCKAYGLTKNGSVFPTGALLNEDLVSLNWTGVVSIDSGWAHVVGLKSDGTVVACGGANYGQCNVAGWRDIIAVAAGEFHTVGLKADGTVVVAGKKANNVSDWKNIIAIAAGNDITLGLRADGTVVCTDSWLNVSKMRLFITEEDKKNYYDEACNLQQQATEEAVEKAYRTFSSLTDYSDSKERAEACLKALDEIKQKKAAERIPVLKAERDRLKEELPTLKGLFSGKRRKEIETRLAEIEKELLKLE